MWMATSQGKTFLVPAAQTPLSSHCIVSAWCLLEGFLESPCIQKASCFCYLLLPGSIIVWVNKRSRLASQRMKTLSFKSWLTLGGPSKPAVTKQIKVPWATLWLQNHCNSTTPKDPLTKQYLVQRGNLMQEIQFLNSQWMQAKVVIS